MQRTYQLSQIAPTRAEEEMAALLIRAGRRHYFAAGTFIQQQGDDGKGFWLIEAGEVSVCRFGLDGDVTVYDILGRGELFGELAHFAGVVRQVDVVAETGATLLKIDAEAIDQLLNTEPEFARWLLRSLANQLRLALDRIDSVRNLSAEARLARALIDMVKRDGPELKTTQEALANFVGVSRVTVGQILSKFARAGYIRRGYRRIVVTQANELADHVSLVST
jgi:CRP-like cAMP-binding protein